MTDTPTRADVTTPVHWPALTAMPADKVVDRLLDHRWAESCGVSWSAFEFGPWHPSVLVISFDAVNPFWVANLARILIQDPTDVERDQMVVLCCAVNLPRLLGHVAQSFGWDLVEVSPTGTGMLRERGHQDRSDVPLMVAARVDRRGMLTLVHDGASEVTTLGVDGTASEAMLRVLGPGYGVCDGCGYVRLTSYRSIVRIVQLCDACREREES